jgi:hypothetical protein
MHNCSKCEKNNTCDSQLNTKDTIRAILNIFMIPFGLFLLGIILGLKSFSENHFKYLVGFAFGIVFLFVYFLMIKKRRSK